jgi:dynein heavy chain, axonemal
MYNSSLGQFLGLFDYGIDKSPKAQLVKERVQIIINWLTRKVYRYINRGLFERDKVTFKLLMATKILIKDNRLTSADVGLLLKAGGGIDDRNNPFASWMQQKQWLNLKALSKHKFNNDHAMFFKELPERINRNEQIWKKWIDENEPEIIPIPDYEEKIQSDQNIGHFIHLCLVRSLREDRTVLACNQFIRDVMGEEYTQPVTD